MKVSLATGEEAEQAEAGEGVGQSKRTIFTFETKAHYVSQVILELEIFLPQQLQSWKCRQVLLHARRKFLSTNPKRYQSSRLKTENERVTAWGK